VHLIKNAALNNSTTYCIFKDAAGIFGLVLITSGVVFMMLKITALNNFTTTEGLMKDFIFFDRSG